MVYLYISGILIQVAYLYIKWHTYNNIIRKWHTYTKCCILAYTIIRGILIIYKLQITVIEQDFMCFHFHAFWCFPRPILAIFHIAKVFLSDSLSFSVQKYFVRSI